MGGAGPGLERIAQQLTLTDAQKASIRDAVRQSRQAAVAAGGNASPPNMAALLIPTDPNHAAAVAAAKQRAAERVQQMVDTQAKIYALLTPEQKAQLANLIASRPQRQAGPRR
jgi:Spy/CpxP family protein refolding chaperone